MAAFSVGDTVKLNSGGPVMTVNEIRSDGEIVCIWFDGNKLIERGFKEAVLKAASNGIKTGDLEIY